MNAASHLLALSVVVFLLTSLAPGTGPVRAEAGDEIRVAIEAHGLEEATYRGLTLSLTLTLTGESPKLLFGDGTFRVSAGLQGRVSGTGVLEPECAVQFHGTAFIPGKVPVDHLVELDVDIEPLDPGSPGIERISYDPEAPLAVVFGPIPPDSEIFPGATLTFRGTGFIFALLPISPDC